MPSFNDLIRQIERDICQYYNFSPLAPAEDFIKTSPSQTDHQGKFSRAETVFRTSANNEDLEISIFLHRDLHELLLSWKQNPTQVISYQLIDALWVVIEELSHFHLILNRIKCSQPFSLLELEFQAEIDKLIFSTILFQRATGTCLFRQLGELIFRSEVSFTTTDRDRYLEAHSLAHEWYRNLEDSYPFGNPTLKNQTHQKLARAYHTPWPQKLKVVGIG